MRPFTNTRAYPIGRLSRESGVKIETIRYYERIALMPRPDRTRGGNRIYDDEQLKRLFFIKRCRELGFGIDEIRALLEMVDRRDFTCADVHGMTVNHLTNVKNKISALQHLAAALQDMASRCNKGDVPNCPIIDVLFDSAVDNRRS